MINGFHHVALSTPDMDRLVTFYCEVLGFEVVFETSWERGSPEIDDHLEVADTSARVVMLRTGTSFMELFQFMSPQTVPGSLAHRVVDHGLTHICFDVDDIQAECARLSAAGVRFHTEPSGYKDEPIRGVYGRDPDGNIIELLQISDEKFSFHMSNRFLGAAA